MKSSTELIRTRLEATMWESNYCRQRMIVLQIQGERLNEELEKNKKADEEKTKKENETSTDKPELKIV